MNIVLLGNNEIFNNEIFKFYNINRFQKIKDFLYYCNNNDLSNTVIFSYYHNVKNLKKELVILDNNTTLEDVINYLEFYKKMKYLSN